MPITLDISGVGLKEYLLFSQTRGIKIFIMLIDKKEWAYPSRLPISHDILYWVFFKIMVIASPKSHDTYPSQSLATLLVKYIKLTIIHVIYC